MDIVPTMGRRDRKSRSQEDDSAQAADLGKRRKRVVWSFIATGSSTEMHCNRVYRERAEWPTPIDECRMRMPFTSHFYLLAWHSPSMPRIFR